MQKSFSNKKLMEYIHKKIKIKGNSINQLFKDHLKLSHREKSGDLMQFAKEYANALQTLNNHLIMITKLLEDPYL